MLNCSRQRPRQIGSPHCPGSYSFGHQTQRFGQPGRHPHRGLGRRIMLQLLVVARKQHARQAWLEVRATNHTAILLYRKLGFHMQGIRKHYYLKRSGRENAIVMARKL